MKEQILSLLAANCSIRVSTDFWLYPQTVITSVYQEDKSFFYHTAYQGAIHHSNVVEILEVIPTKRPEYKVGDKVMMLDDGKWFWPYTVRRSPHSIYLGVSWGKWMYANLNNIIVCPFHEWVQYNHTKACEACWWDWIEKCNNPDHGLIDGVIRGLWNAHGCPVCGFDDKCRVPSRDWWWLQCETCKWSGVQYNPLPTDADNG